VRDGIVHFIDPAELGPQDRRFAHLYDWFAWVYPAFTRIGFALIGTSEARGRAEVLDRLEPYGGRVLEVSARPGSNLPYLVGRPDVGEVHALDISLGQLRRCRTMVHRRGWAVPLYLASAEALPFADATFDAVLHIGGINFFDDKASALAEMARVAKPGVRIVVVDENEPGARAYERTPARLPQILPRRPTEGQRPDRQHPRRDAPSEGERHLARLVLLPGVHHPGPASSRARMRRAQVTAHPSAAWLGYAPRSRAVSGLAPTLPSGSRLGQRE
jgi:ubiquinone/menaquinone biosynthesis C-methylase UbiE